MRIKLEIRMTPDEANKLFGKELDQDEGHLVQLNGQWLPELQVTDVYKMDDDCVVFTLGD